MNLSAGESFEVTNNGELVALLVPAPEDPFDRLVASGKVQRAQSGTTFSQLVRTAGISSSDIVDDIRGEW